MRQNNESFQFRKGFRVILTFILAISFVFEITAGIRPVDIAISTNPSSTTARQYFINDYKFGGGVVPRGTAQFLSPTNQKLGAEQLELVILDEAKLRNNVSDYDAIGIRWQNNVYELTTQDDLIYPLMQFVQRGSYIAYTVPVLGIDKDYFEKSALMKRRGDYVAKEFMRPAHTEFLTNIDLGSKYVDIPSDIEASIKNDINRENDIDTKRGTFVNADFHVNYQVYLGNDANGKRVADVGGLPLVYLWKVSERGNAIITNVGGFAFPREEFDLQYRAVLFFQTAAILRQFKLHNRAEFDRFMNELAAVLRSQP